MNLLLDTHVILWYISGDQKLPRKIINAINNPSNRCFISIASIWEIAIKMSLGKLEIVGGFTTIENFLKDNDFEILPIDIDDTKTLLSLEFIHRDPFDRMIVAQSITSGLVLVTRDIQLRDYQVEVLW